MNTQFLNRLHQNHASAAQEWRAKKREFFDRFIDVRAQKYYEKHFHDRYFAGYPNLLECLYDAQKMIDLDQKADICRFTEYLAQVIEAQARSDTDEKLLQDIWNQRGHLKKLANKLRACGVEIGGHIDTAIESAGRTIERGNIPPDTQENPEINKKRKIASIKEDVKEIQLHIDKLKIIYAKGESETYTMNGLPGCGNKPRKDEIHRWKIIHNGLCGHEISNGDRFKINETFRKLWRIKEKIIDRHGKIAVKIVNKGESFKRHAMSEHALAQKKYFDAPHGFSKQHPDTMDEY